MDVREKLARLNPKIVRYDADTGGGGGVPGLTDQDVAAALAFVPAGLGRELLIAVNWPDGAERAPQKLWREVVAVVHGEMSKQHSKLARAQSELGWLRSVAETQNKHTEAMRRELQRAESIVSSIKQVNWPAETMVVLPAMVNCLLSEMQTSAPCKACGGTGCEADGETKCAECEGSGKAAGNVTRRAESIGRARAKYYTTWRAPFEWLARHFSEAEEIAAQQLASALRGG